MLWTAGSRNMATKAPINKIISFSNVDGPSNRTSVFFQGCHFNCLFCHNPETINLCIDCGICMAKCPAGAISRDEENRITWDREKCVNCDTCIQVCPHNSSPKIQWMTPEGVMQEIRRSAPYISGITCSGGECTIWYEFMLELFQKVKAIGKTCLIDSNGSFDFEKDPRILEYCDGVMLDVKAADPEWDRKLTGAERDIVIKNLHYLLSADKLYEVRTLIFPDRDQENEETVRYVAETIGDRCFYKIIRYRPFGVREENRKILGEFTTDEQYAEKYAQLARDLGASKAYVV